MFLLHNCFNYFEAVYKTVNFNPSISRCCNELLLERSITELEGNNLNNAQCDRKETLEINPVSSVIAVKVLEQSLCQALSLTRISVERHNLQACHLMRKKNRVIIKCRKQMHRVISNHKSLQNETLDITQLKCSGKAICK